MSNEHTILIIEDEKPIMSILKMKLNSEDFKTLEATDGESGLEIALKSHPDLILLDIMLPIMDGVTFLEKLRKNSWGNKVPVIILSNLNDAKTVEESRAKGVYDYLVKTDWKLEDVIAKVKSTLNIKS